MNHRPFEDWLLDDQPLTPQQERDLQAHVRTCASCTAIAETNLALRTARQVEPALGFSDRFHMRLEKRRREQRWLQVIGTLVLVVGGLGLVYWAASPWILEALHSPAVLLAAGVSYLVFIVTSLQVLTEATAILWRVLPTFVSPAGWFLLIVGVAALGHLWTFSIRRVARVPRGV